VKKNARKHGMAPIDEILKGWRRKVRASWHAGPPLHAEWKLAVGEEIALHTRVIDVSGGELLVEVDSSPLLNELSTYSREEILGSLQRFESFRGVRKLRFRAGSFADAGAEAGRGAPGGAREGEKGRRERRYQE
jgi:hypothetical protein